MDINGYYLGLGNIIRPEAPIILIAIFLFLIFRDFTDFRIIKKNILSFIGILFTFIIITKGASFLILKSGQIGRQGNKYYFQKLFCMIPSIPQIQEIYKILGIFS